MDFVELTKVLGPSLSMVAIVLVTFVATLKIYLQYKQKLAEKEPEEDAFRTEQAPQNLDNLAELLVQNFRILNSFYSESLSDEFDCEYLHRCARVCGYHLRCLDRTDRSSSHPRRS